MTGDTPLSHVAVGARRDADDLRDAVDLLRPLRTLLEERKGKEPGSFAQLFDAEAVAGPLHLASALARASRARARGRPRLTDPGAEVALYLAGTDQLPEALRRVGISRESREVVLLLSPEGPTEETLRRLSLRADPSVYPRAPTTRTLERLGLDPADASSVPPDRWEALAVEAGARVELSRAPSGGRKG